MRFVIQGLKYDTDKMKKIANVKKWYKTNSLLVKALPEGHQDEANKMIAQIQENYDENRGR